MKPTSLLLPGAALLSCAFAQDAYLWTIDHGTVKGPATQSSSITSDTAHMIIARRRGMAQNIYLHTVDQTVLNDINQYGGFQQQLFGANKDKAAGKLLIRINGFDGAASQFTMLPDLWIEGASKDLQDDFGARNNVEGVCEYDLSVPTKPGVDIMYSYTRDDKSCLTSKEVEKLPAIITVYSATPTGEEVATGMTALLRMMSHLSVTENIESTIVVLPPASRLRKVNTRRSAQIEEPLDLPIIVSPDSTSDVVSVVKSNSTKPVTSFVPRCFTSESTCNNATNACSGRGSCYKSSAHCFQCRCGSTTIRDDDTGKKTVQWGGNACQKKDISVPFALFAGFGIFMTAVLAGGISMLYNMGAQELPSVLGAGVGGPRAQK